MITKQNMIKNITFQRGSINEITLKKCKNNKLVKNKQYNIFRKNNLKK